MLKKIVILTNEDQSSIELPQWAQIGSVVSELAEVYQIVKERQIDLIIVDSHRSDLKAAVANRIRRYNGLTEIWKMENSDVNRDELPVHLDGVMSVDLGVEGITGKIEQILKTKALLSRYLIVGRSDKIKVVAETIDRIAATDISVLIVGASGSGKELVARAIHNNSERSKQPFVAINCGAIAQGVLESELFGHEKGAFTGSVSRREGIFHKADKGTIFLDEIGETVPDMQVKLLRVLEDGTYYPVGSSTTSKTDVRVISATNRDLAQAINEKAFREDLYFRLSVVKINVPPLLERKSDIQPLLSHFWSQSGPSSYTDASLELLNQYDWPGNVRQLKNFADRMIAFKPGGTVDKDDVTAFLDEQQSTATHLPVSTGRTSDEAGQELIYRAIISLGNEIRLLRDLITSHLPTGQPGSVDSSGEVLSGSGMTMDEMEEQLIHQALEESVGNRKVAARRLGISERTLYRKLKRYDLN